ncbi:hypothetical protein, partial [Enterobacter hormaechei]|uniref:hypothetical protein n=1 Tax=Enterobacter hormaechei TaxID=158836 RepID=UPI00203D254F
ASNHRLCSVEQTMVCSRSPTRGRLLRNGMLYCDAISPAHAAQACIAHAYVELPWHQSELQLLQ